MREPFYSEQDGRHYILEDKGHYHLMRVISAAYGDERGLSVDALDDTAAIGSWNLHLETFPPWGRVNQAYHGGSTAVTIKEIHYHRRRCRPMLGLGALPRKDISELSSGYRAENGASPSL